MAWLAKFSNMPSDLFYRIKRDATISLGDHWMMFYPNIPLENYTSPVRTIKNGLNFPGYTVRNTSETYNTLYV